MKLSNNFSSKEFACKGTGCCGNSSPISPILIYGLEKLRSLVCKKLGKETPLKINSGFRCRTYNARIGGASDSRHPLGDGADVDTPDGLTDKEFYGLAEKVPAFRDGGIGLYSGRIHVDCREGKARWTQK